MSVSMSVNKEISRKLNQFDVNIVEKVFAGITMLAPYQ